MTNTNIIFDEATREYGGLAPTNEVFDTLRASYNRIIMDYSEHAGDFVKSPPKVIVDFVNDNSFNALATVHGDHYIIGINKGMYYILMDLFGRLLSRRDLLIHVGNAFTEKQPPMIPGYLFHAGQLTHNGKMGVRMMPSDPQRISYCYHLTRIVLDLIFHHEYSHILFGHVDLVNHELGVTCLTEIFSAKPPLSGLDFQTLEFDADNTGFARFFNLPYSWVCDYPDLKNPNGGLFKTDFYEMIYDISIASGMMTHLFGMGNYPNIVIDSQTHPDPMSRFFGFFAIVEAVIADWNIPADMQKVRDVQQHAIKEIYRCIQALSERLPTPEEIEFYGDHPIVSGFLENWKTSMRTRLLPFTFRVLAD